MEILRSVVKKLHEQLNSNLAVETVKERISDAFNDHGVCSVLNNSKVLLFYLEILKNLMAH